MGAGARIAQRAPTEMRPWTTAVDVKRGGTSVYPTASIPVLSIPFFQGVGFVCWDFVIPSTGVPASGAWTFVCSELAGFRTQTFGHVFVVGISTLATLTAGTISTAAAIAAGNTVSIRGMVGS